jgi:CCR4-NOT transcriptional complex subunit CAF120
MASIDSPQPQSHDLRPPTTDEAPLHPEIRSIVFLATAHTKKIYFAGPLVHKVERILVDHTHGDERWRDVRAQLCGTTLNIWDMGDVEGVQQGKEDPSSSVDITEAVRPPFQLHCLRDSTNPSSPVRLCSRFHNTACDTDVFRSYIH